MDDATADDAALLDAPGASAAEGRLADGLCSALAEGDDEGADGPDGEPDDEHTINVKAISAITAGLGADMQSMGQSMGGVRGAAISLGASESTGLGTHGPHALGEVTSVEGGYEAREAAVTAGDSQPLPPHGHRTVSC